MNSTKRADRMIQSMNIKFRICTEPCIKAATAYINIFYALRHDLSPNLFPKLLQQSFESG